MQLEPLPERGAAATNYWEAPMGAMPSPRRLPISPDGAEPLGFPYGSQEAVRYSIRSCQSLLSATFVACVLHGASLEEQSCRQADHAVAS